MRDAGADVGRDDRRVQRAHGRAGGAVTARRQPARLRRLRRRAGAAATPYPFRCPNAGRRRRRPRAAARARPRRGRVPAPATEPNPFVRYRGAAARLPRRDRGGLTDGEFCALVRRLDERVAAVDGHGFAVTPFGASDELSDALGFSAAAACGSRTRPATSRARTRPATSSACCSISRSPSGSACADPPQRPDLAIASCGNAALAAAVVAARRRRRAARLRPGRRRPGRARRGWRSSARSSPSARAARRGRRPDLTALLRGGRRRARCPSPARAT